MTQTVKTDYEHCRKCGAALSSYSDVFCRQCREQVDKTVRKLTAELLRKETGK